MLVVLLIFFVVSCFFCRLYLGYGEDLGEGEIGASVHGESQGLVCAFAFGLTMRFFEVFDPGCHIMPSIYVPVFFL